MAVIVKIEPGDCNMIERHGPPQPVDKRVPDEVPALGQRSQIDGLLHGEVPGGSGFGLHGGETFKIDLAQDFSVRVKRGLSGCSGF